jgi:hypothetical protein
MGSVKGTAGGLLETDADATVGTSTQFFCSRTKFTATSTSLLSKLSLFTKHQSWKWWVTQWRRIQNRFFGGDWIRKLLDAVIFLATKMMDPTDGLNPFYE